MRPPPRVQHRLVVRHPRRDAILIEESERGARLPAIETDDRHTAEVAYLNAAARERLGLVTTVLASLAHSDPHRAPVVRAHALMVHGGDALATPALRWCSSDALPPALDPTDREALRAWAASAGAIVDGREWTRAGWLDEARAWLESVLPGGGLEIVQLRTWPSSCVLRVRANGSEFYLKALCESLRRECTLTAYLAREFPQALPRVVASLPARRWLLLAACSGVKLEEVTDLALWERAARTYGALQRACTSRVDALLAAGCAERPLSRLRAGIEPLASDTPAFRVGEPEGFEQSEVERMRALVPALTERCDELESYGIAATLEHGDLWPGNFFVNAQSCALIDWEDACVGHPFLSLAPLRVGLRLAGLDTPAARARLNAAYLAAFAGVAPEERLRGALRAAAPLAFVDMALRYRAQRPSFARLHPWMFDLVPQALRYALELLE
jgi:hypothetical protein